MVDTNTRLLYNVNEMREALGVGRGLAYQLLARNDFPKIVINGRYYIPVEKLRRWIDKESRKS